MKTTWLIGCVCKSGDTFSLAVLIDRGLDLQIRRMLRTFFGYSGVMPAVTIGLFAHSLVTLFSSQGLGPFKTTVERLWSFLYFNQGRFLDF